MAKRLRYLLLMLVLSLLCYVALHIHYITVVVGDGKCIDKFITKMPDTKGEVEYYYLTVEDTTDEWQYHLVSKSDYENIEIGQPYKYCKHKLVWER